MCPHIIKQNTKSTCGLRQLETQHTTSHVSKLKQTKQINWRKNIPFRSASIRRHNDRVMPFSNVLLYPLQYCWLGIQVIDWNIKEALEHSKPAIIT